MKITISADTIYQTEMVTDWVYLKAQALNSSQKKEKRKENWNHHQPKARLYIYKQEMDNQRFELCDILLIWGRIISAKIRRDLRRNKKLTSKASQYDWSSPANCDINNLYTITERKMFDTLLKTFDKHTWRIWKLCYRPYRNSSWVYTNHIKSQI